MRSWPNVRLFPPRARVSTRGLLPFRNALVDGAEAGSLFAHFGADKNGIIYSRASLRFPPPRPRSAFFPSVFPTSRIQALRCRLDNGDNRRARRFGQLGPCLDNLRQIRVLARA